MVILVNPPKRLSLKPAKPTIIEGMKRAFANWAHAYETRDGQVFIAQRIEEVKKQMREIGWRNVSQLDERHFIDAGFIVIIAQYVSGARKTGKFIRVVTLGERPRKSKTYGYLVRQDDATNGR